jgi:hypothetical protein
VASVLDRLGEHGLLGRVVFEDSLRELLADLTIQPGSQVTGSVETGICAVGAISGRPLGVFDLELALPLPEVPFRLELDGGASPTGFHFWLHLSDAPPAQALFTFLDKPGYALSGAAIHTEADDQEWLEPTGEQVELRGAELSLLVRGSATEPAVLLLTPTQGGPDRIVALELHPPTVLIADSRFGLELPQGLVLDSSEAAAAPGTTEIMGEALTLAADTPSWQGTVVRKARLFFPRGVPLLGGHAVETFLTIGSNPPGIDFGVATRIPAEGDRPEIGVRIECRDPTARGLAGMLPTLVEGSMELPLDGQESFDGQSIAVLAGTPVSARVSLAREPTATPPSTRVTLGLEAQGDRGILTIDAAHGGSGEKAAVAAAALATALIADGAVPVEQGPDGDESGVYLHLLLAVAVGLSNFLRQEGHVVLHGVELQGEGPGLAIADKLRLTLDYSVDAVLETFTVGVLGVEMLEDQPLRVRVRKVVLTIDQSKSGLKQFHLGFDRATTEIEDPGGWKVKGPGSMFDVLGTRSGRGSMWIEVDLRFKLDLGPVKVEGATIRGTLGDDGRLTAELRGLAASLTVPGVIDGKGRVAIEEGGFKAALDVEVIPLNVRADAFVQVDPPLVALGLGVDLPGAIPLANSGLGIYGLAGAFAANGKPGLPAGPDLISRQLAWSYQDDGFEKAPGSTTIGVEAVIGTVPDLGFSFSAKAGLFLTLPDVAIRVGLSGKVMSPRLKVTDRPDEEVSFGPSFRGVVVIDPADGVTIGLLGSYEVPFLLDARVPLGAHFPVKGDDWFIYLGADGYPKQERALGPIQAELLPELVGTRGGGFLMMRGHGIERFGRGHKPVTAADGFILAFGFGFEYVLGIRGLIWAEIHASADILLTTNPMLFAGFGQVGGSLNLGPISIGVDAQLEFLLQEGHDPYLFAQVCGHVDLFFFELEGCVEIEVGDTPLRSVPAPNEHPLDRKEGEQVLPNAALIDGTYRKVAELVPDFAIAETVWPDTLVQLAFATPPRLDPSVGGTQFPGVTETYGERARQVGSEMLSYDWTLTKLELRDVTGDEHGPGTLVPGELSAAWQPGRSGDVEKTAEPAELVLLTPRGDVWLGRTADGGRGLAHDPLGDLANSCKAASPARVGWMLGWDAESTSTGHRLSPALLSSDPTQSQLRGVATAHCSLLPDDLVLTPRSARLLPFGFGYDASHPVAFPDELTLRGKEPQWRGYLTLGDVATSLYGTPIVGREVEVRQTWTIELDDDIVSGRIWLVLDRREGVEVSDDRGAHWERSEEVELEDGQVAVRFEARHGDPIRAVSVTWGLWPHPGFIALGGISGRARAAAEARAKARKARAEQLKTAKNDGPQQAHHAFSRAHPSVLRPGRTYRVDVDLAWAGTLKTRDEDGNDTPTTASGDSYLPPGAAGPVPCARSYWFRTADLQKPSVGADGTLQPLMQAAPKFGEKGLYSFIKQKRDVFHPAMLERHFLSYEPAQSEQFRFCDDPLRAHFGVDHVVKLADAYGFRLKLAVNRTDAAMQAQELDPTLTALLVPGLLDAVGKHWNELALTTDCDVPSPGATLGANAALVPEAWYELHVLAQSKDDRILDGRLPSVTFRTSRWRNPGELLDALGFLRDGVGQRSGDLELYAEGELGSPVDGSDATFEAALAAIGHAGLPAAQATRTSLLWRAGPPGSWLLAGALIESPEPIHRPGRVELERLSFVELGGDDPARSFDRVWRDRVGARLLFLANEPIVLGPPAPRLNLHLLDVAAGISLAGRLEVPAAPSFAGEPR